MIRVSCENFCPSWERHWDFSFQSLGQSLAALSWSLVRSNRTSLHNRFTDIPDICHFVDTSRKKRQLSFVVSAELTHPCSKTSLSLLLLVCRHPTATPNLTQCVSILLIFILITSWAANLIIYSLWGYPSWIFETSWNLIVCPRLLSYTSTAPDNRLIATPTFSTFRAEPFPALRITSCLENVGGADSDPQFQRGRGGHRGAGGELIERDQ